MNDEIQLKKIVIKFATISWYSNPIVQRWLTCLGYMFDKTVFNTKSQTCYITQM